ncbi:MAG TPA: hypothetical protein VJT15_06130 [Pyrinomonadaceae bacterium]|nr:hypothetical protein [Pyrinomonadaceae bacterium]
MKKYPDVSQILARKALGRKALERLPVNEKLQIMETLSKAAKQARKDAKLVNKPSKTTKVA